MSLSTSSTPSTPFLHLPQSSSKPNPSTASNNEKGRNFSRPQTIERKPIPSSSAATTFPTPPTVSTPPPPYLSSNNSLPLQYPDDINDDDDNKQIPRADATNANIPSQIYTPSSSSSSANTSSDGGRLSGSPPTQSVFSHTRNPVITHQASTAMPIAQKAPILHVEQLSVDPVRDDISEFDADSDPRLHPHSHFANSSLESLPRRPSSNTLNSSSNSDVLGSQTRPYHRQHLSVGGLNSTSVSASPGGSPMLLPQDYRYSRYSSDNRPISYVDLVNTTYAQQIAPTPNLDNSFLRRNVGSSASLLDAAKTLDMYSANVAKTNDPAIQYEFAVYMVQIATELANDNPQREDLLRKAKVILTKIADKGYPFSQYYLGDGYASGLFNKGKEDWDRAFPLFVAASKRGHAEAIYRTALCYEFGWGCQKNYSKAAYNYQVAATKNHPGAATRYAMACIYGTMGLQGKSRDGINWLKRGVDSADTQYNSAPYELAKLHENGYLDIVFKDEEYAARLFTQSAELGHADANLVMGKAYEHELLQCPRDNALSVHFYTMAANAGEPEAMLALCAAYVFGAEPGQIEDFVWALEKNEPEAFAWALKAAELGDSKAEYTVGYFKENGIGCTPDSVGANLYYWRAAQKGEERAKTRLAAIQMAAAGEPGRNVAMKREVPKSKRGLFSKLGL